MKDCGVTYKDPDSFAGTFLCDDVDVWATQLDIELQYQHDIPEMMNEYPVISIGPYFGCGIHRTENYVRYGLVGDLRMDWEPFDLGLRVSWGYHGILQTVYGIGLVGWFHVPKQKE